MRISHINSAEKRELSGLEAGPSSGDSSHSPVQRQQKPREKPAQSRKVKAAYVPTPAPIVAQGPQRVLARLMSLSPASFGTQNL